MIDIYAQDQLTYQVPSNEILELVDIKQAPSVIMDSERNFMVQLFRNPFKSIEDLSEEELRLAGLRIDPVKNIGSRVSYVNEVKVKNLKTNSSVEVKVTGFPDKIKLSNFKWSPDQTKIAVTNTTATQVELWVIDLPTITAKKISNLAINANLGDVINWFKDGNSVLVKIIPNTKKALIDSKNAVPTGPTITVSDGKKAQNRTYQDLLKNANDEFNFEQLANSNLYKISLDGKIELWQKEVAMYSSIYFSPDGQYVLLTTIEKPFSYIVPYDRFPSTTKVFDQSGKEISTILEQPLLEELPKGFMATFAGRRSITWRGDKPCNLIYTKALDEGDPGVEVPFRDEVFELEAPFTGEGRSILKTINRYRYTLWGDNNMAIAYDSWWNTRNQKTYLYNPSKSNDNATVISDRNYQDQYGDPGSFITERNSFGTNTLSMQNGNLFLIGDGFSEDGQKPFIHQYNIETKSSNPIYISEIAGKIENILSYDAKSNRALVRIESPSEYPNYYFRDLQIKELDSQLSQITAFPNPFASMKNVHKEVIKYNRADGLELSGTLYLPDGYDMNAKEKMPMIMWAYPREYKDKSSASQSTANPNEFIYPFWGSPLYWVMKGYVVLDDAAFPIIGEGDEQPNDTFLEQLVSNAKAGIDAVDKLGYIDRTKVAVGGHSYGAFMVANLLSHSDLFAAGIARSGAYNRTLTPFGFQSEERSYWEAPAVYNTMSPFMNADKMKTPLLLIHGEADNNSGTYPLQSERYFNALKGLGAPVRLVMLPKESHGYAAKESILHLLWEQDMWLDTYVKNKVDSDKP